MAALNHSRAEPEAPDLSVVHVELRFGAEEVTANALDDPALRGSVMRAREAVVRVRDTIAPEMTALRLTPDLLSPANHRLVDLFAAYAASDASGTPICALTVSSSEPPNGRGDGNTAVDSIVIDAQHVQLRAEPSTQRRDRI